jgi:hypothetical protein
MEKHDLKKYIPHAAAILLFVLISLIYFSPALEGKKLKQGDIERFKGMSKEITDYRKMTGEEPLWTRSMFSGMPAYFISVEYSGNLFRTVNKVLQLGLPHPANQLFLYFLGFFILMLVLRINPWLAIVGSLAFAFSSYFFIIIEAGHNSKALAISYMAPVLAGIILAFRGRYLTGGLLTAFFLSLEIAANHFQITYYLMLMIVIYGIYELVATIREKRWTNFLKASGSLLIAAVLALGVNATSLLISYDHTPYTTRGKSELTFNQENKTSGLDRDYVTAWSYGVSETMTLAIPRFMGGASYGQLGENSRLYDALTKNGFRKQDALSILKQVPLYWGQQPFTSGPVYAGAIIFFLFIFGLFIVKGKLRWWLLTVTVLAIMLAWGKNMMWFTNLFLDYFPAYNKFRAVSMTLVIADLAMPVLAMLALAKVFGKETDRAPLMKGLKYSTAIIGGIFLLLLLVPQWFFNFSGNADADFTRQLADISREYFRSNAQASDFASALAGDRVRILRLDTLRSLLFILLSAGLIWFYLKGKIKKAGIVIAGIGILVLADMWPINKNYLNNENFERSRLVDNPYQPSEADNEIMRDREPGFRVLNLTVSPFNDASTSFFHHSVGGYHGAKLKRYQEIIEYHIEPEMRRLINVLRDGSTPERLEMILGESPVLNMLNTKYFVIMGKQGPILYVNPHRPGPAWFAEAFEFVAGADEEISRLGEIDPLRKAIIDIRYEAELQGKDFMHDTLGHIALTDYKPNHMTYTSRASSEQLAIFSEVYYPAGWKACIDGKPAAHFRANYVLRAMVVPAGEHTIEFKFEPEIFHTGETLSLIFSIILLSLILLYIIIELRKHI